MNIYLTADRELVFEFALAGFDEKDIDLSFTGDYMNFSARILPSASDGQDIKYFKRRLKLKDIEKQKYFVPTDKFDQQAVKAVFNSFLTTFFGATILPGLIMLLLRRK